VAKVYIIPTVLDPEGYAAIPAYITTAIRDCRVIFTENERTTRRYLKSLWKTLLPDERIEIDDFEWHVTDEQAPAVFRQKLKEGKTIGILSEAGCPVIADPGQNLVAIAHELNADVKPLAGPSSILLALMASGMNGQSFRFHGYLPIPEKEKTQAIHSLETDAAKNHSTQIFIETPYRNNQLMATLVNTCRPATRLCIAVDITGPQELIRTKTIAEWKKEKVDIHKRPAIFLLSL
jgi:16S rRNA (cytidine1402-2'-O)-methyltransferase